MSKKLEYDKDKDHYPGPGTYNRFSEFGILDPRKKKERMAKSAKPNYIDYIKFAENPENYVHIFSE